MKTVVPDILQNLAKAAKEQGDVVAFRRGVLFCHPDAVRDLLITQAANFEKSRLLRWARLTLGKGLLTADGALHRRQRPIIQPMLHPKKLAGYAQIMARHADETADSWNNGQPIDAHREMMRLTLRIVAEALFSQSIGPEADAISRAMDLNVQAFRQLTRPWGWLRAILPSPSNLRYLIARQKLLGVLRNFITDRRTSGSSQDDLLSRMINAKDETDKPAMSERQLIDECVTLFAAGHETTANALTFTLWLLAHHPEAQSKLFDEIDQELQGATPLIEDLDRLPFARAVISESMRCFPPAWIQARTAIRDCAIAGTPVKRGHTVFISQWVTHHDRRWWTEPEKFVPERFLDETENGRPRWAYFPFGGGPRNCIGESFAWAEAMLVLVVLLQKWRITVRENPSIELEPGITLRPAGIVTLIPVQRTVKSSSPSLQKANQTC